MRIEFGLWGLPPPGVKVCIGGGGLAHPWEASTAPSVKARGRGWRVARRSMPSPSGSAMGGFGTAAGSGRPGHLPVERFDLFLFGNSSPGGSPAK